MAFMTSRSSPSITGRGIARDANGALTLVELALNPKAAKAMVLELKEQADRAVEAETHLAERTQQAQAKEVELLDREKALQDKEQGLAKAIEQLQLEKAQLAQQGQQMEAEVVAHREMVRNTQNAHAAAKTVIDQREATFRTVVAQRTTELDRREAELHQRTKALNEEEKSFIKERDDWQKRIDEIRQLTA